jgi:hypothetical protein
MSLAVGGDLCALQISSLTTIESLQLTLAERLVVVKRETAFVGGKFLEGVKNNQAFDS